MSKNGVAIIINNSSLGPKTKSSHLETSNDSQCRDGYLTLTNSTSLVGVTSHETRKYISQNTVRHNENSSVPSFRNDSELSPKTGGVKRGFDNKAFSNDDCEAEHIVKNDAQKYSILSQEKLMHVYVCKTPRIDHNDEKSQQVTSGKSIEKDESLQENGNLTKDTLSIHAERSTEDKVGKKDEKEKKDRKKEGESDNDTVVTWKEADDIAATETCMDSEEENLEPEPMDMFYALARSSVDLRGKVLKTHKVSKIRKTFIIFSCFFMQMCLGILFSLGILYVELLDAFGTNRSLTSLVQSLPLGLAYILGLIVGPLIQKLGLRVSIFCGGLLTATGFIASSFVNSIYAIIILVGVVSGTGFSLLNIGTYTSVPVYFGKQQRIAVAFTSFGTGTGAALWPLINRVLLKEYEWRGNLLISGGILLNICTLSLLFKPLPMQKEQKESQGAKKSLSMRQKVLQLMKIPTFLALMLWCIFDGFSSSVVGQMIVDFSRENGYGRDHGETLLIYFSITNAIGRATVGIISRFNISSFLTFALSSILCGSSYVTLAFTSDYWMTLVVTIVSGFMVGSHVALIMIVLLKTVGSDLYGLGWGITATCLGIGLTASGPIAGYIADVRSYNVSYYVAGLTMITAMIVYGTINIICRCMKKKSVTF